MRQNTVLKYDILSIGNCGKECRIFRQPVRKRKETQRWRCRLTAAKQAVLFTRNCK
ncbi:MAG: hypothetical protein K2I96_13095 [Lachnospiraceae bacterium]|nr:hypothetical protein [Lachnospiraceae bacterium]